MSLQDWLALGLPLATIALAVYATHAGPLGTYLAAKTHNELLGRIVNASGRIAADIRDALTALKPGDDPATVKAELLAAAVTELKTEFAGSVAYVGATDPKLLTIVSRELSKLSPAWGTTIAGELIQGSSMLLPLDAVGQGASAIPNTPVPATPAAPPAPAAQPSESTLMRNLLVPILFAGLLLTACTPTQLATTETYVAKTTGQAQLYCGLATAAGPLTVALVSAADPNAAPVAVTTAEAVQYACGLVQGIPVSPPPAGVVAPIVAVQGNLPTVPPA